MTAVVLGTVAVVVGFAAADACRPRPRRPWAGVSSSPRPLPAVLVIAAVGAVLIGPIPTAFVVVAVAGGRWWRGRRAVARAEAARAVAVVDVIELVALSLRGGTGPLSVLDDVVDDVPTEVREPVESACRLLADGVSLDRALLPLRAAGGRRAEALCALLVRGVSDGVALADPALALARRARDDERRRLEAQARRLPVVLLAPMFVCIVPAFVLLVVVPMLIVGIRAVSAF